MFRLVIVLVYLRFAQTMSPITKHLLTPLREQGEVCGYQSCPFPVKGVLNIHVIPHTHAELGYTRTFDQHFNGRDEFYDKSNINMKRILDYVITELWADKERKFTFSDLPYLYKWWSIRDDTVHRMVYQLIRQGRLHIVGGGWSMADEATANYQAIIDQFTYSLRKLNATFLDCARPYVTWQSDVFGHTNEFASLMAQMGFDGHFINPISYDDEIERMRSKRLEFVWRGSHDLGSASEIFTHKLFDGYWSPPGFCFGGQCNDPLITTSNSAFNNVQERVKLFVESMQHRQSPHYATDHLVVMMGQRFGYYDAPLWFENIDKLIRSVNEYSSRNNVKMTMYYSTPACYLKAVHESNVSFPVETDDFVPVAYDKFTHFSGIFTSRPTLKYAVREGNVYLQITKQLQVLARLANNDKFFEDFHWIMGVLQDHNILTGGMRPYVRDYYVNKIYNTLGSSERVIRDVLINLMKTPRMGYQRCLFNISYCEYIDRDNYHIVIYNPLAWNVTIPVRLPVNDRRFNVFLPNLKKVQSAVITIPECIQAIPYNRTKTFHFEIVFIAEDVPAFGYRSYFVEKVSRMTRSVYSDDHFTKKREKNDKFGNLDDNLSRNGVKNDKFDEINNFVDKTHDTVVRSVNSKDLFTNYTVINDSFVSIDDHLRNINDLFTRKTRSVDNKDHFTDEERQNDKHDEIDDHLRTDRAKNYQLVQLQNVNRNINNLNNKVHDVELKPDTKILQEPLVTKIIKFNKNVKPNKDLKRIFESISDEGDNIELDIVFGSTRKNQSNNAYKETKKQTRVFNLNESTKDFNAKYGYSNKKYDDNVTEYISHSIKEHTTSKPNNSTVKIDSDYLNKDDNAKSKIDKEKLVKNENRNILKGLKRCNCKIGTPKRNLIENNSGEAANDIIDHTFGNKTSKIIHFQQKENTKRDDEVSQNHDVTKGFKREVKVLEQDVEDKIKDLINEILDLKRKIKDIKQHKVKYPAKDQIKKLTREINNLRNEIENLLKIKRPSNETRSERSLFKKIKNAKKKYLRRQTSNLKIDDDSLLNNDHHFDDNDISEEDDDFENTTEANDQYVFEHVTDYSDYVVTPKSRDGSLKPVEEATRITTSATKKTATTTKSTTTTTTTETPNLVISKTTDSYISNEYINITTDINKNVSYIALANGLTMALNINFYYYASDDPMKMARPTYKKPGAYVFRPMDPEPVFIAQRPKIEVYKSSIVEEIHSNADLASFVIRLYRNTPYFEVQWILRGIPISDGIGKEVFIRFSTDLQTNGVFYTDANGRQTIRRVYGHRPGYPPAAPDAIAGNFYPVTSKITIEDPRRMIRFSVFNDRTQGGSSFKGDIDLMLNRRLLTDDAGIQAFINETENEIGTTVTGKHYIYITKLSTKVNKIFEKKLAKEIGLKPQIFLPNKMVEKSAWKHFQNEFLGVHKIPIGLNILTLQEWNDGSFLLRIENYLEKNDVLKTGTKKVVLKNLFTVFRITKVRETTLAGNIFMEDFLPLSWQKNNGNTDSLEPLQEVKVDEEISFKPQQIRTFIIWIEFHK